MNDVRRFDFESFALLPLRLEFERGIVRTPALMSVEAKRVASTRSPNGHVIRKLLDFQGTEQPQRSSWTYDMFATVIPERTTRIRPEPNYHASRRTAYAVNELFAATIRSTHASQRVSASVHSFEFSMIGSCN